ncbi:MAG: type II toxin-antitoxin system YoeB family toxin [Hyphomonas sp.]
MKGDLSGWWSRRITQADRLIYKVNRRGDDRALIITACHRYYQD